jgi:hypothetical protein
MLGLSRDKPLFDRYRGPGDFPVVALDAQDGSANYLLIAATAGLEVAKTQHATWNRHIRLKFVENFMHQFTPKISNEKAGGNNGLAARYRPSAPLPSRRCGPGLTNMRERQARKDRASPVEITR